MNLESRISTLEKRIKNLKEEQANAIFDPQIIKAIEAVLAKGDRVELIPVKNGVKVVKVKRETVNDENRSK